MSVLCRCPTFCYFLHDQNFGLAFLIANLLPRLRLSSKTDGGSNGTILEPISRGVNRLIRNPGEPRCLPNKFAIPLAPPRFTPSLIGDPVRIVAHCVTLSVVSRDMSGAEKKVGSSPKPAPSLDIGPWGKNRKIGPSYRLRTYFRRAVVHTVQGIDPRTASI
jgi:hypothetical protein